MNSIATILQESRDNNWPYPKRFEALKKIGVHYHTVRFINDFESIYEGDFGIWREPASVGHTYPDLVDIFSEEDIKNAILERAQGKTTYFEFLDALAAGGVSHYKADMKNNTVTYFNRSEEKFYQQKVPVWKE